jgi:hypothetical protein
MLVPPGMMGPPGMLIHEVGLNPMLLVACTATTGADVAFFTHIIGLPLSAAQLTLICWAPAFVEKIAPATAMATAAMVLEILVIW